MPVITFFSGQYDLSGGRDANGTIVAGDGTVYLRRLVKSLNHFVDLNSTSFVGNDLGGAPGSFTMGLTGVADPEHNVTLTEGFYLGKFEVTQAQYEAVMNGNANGLNPTPSHFSGYPNRPVEKVSWNDIQVFLSRINTLESNNIPVGWFYVLPTEAQCGNMLAVQEPPQRIRGEMTSMLLMQTTKIM